MREISGVLEKINKTQSAVSDNTEYVCSKVGWLYFGKHILTQSQSDSVNVLVKYSSSYTHVMSVASDAISNMKGTLQNVLYVFRQERLVPSTRTSERP